MPLFHPSSQTAKGGAATLLVRFAKIVNPDNVASLPTDQERAAQIAAAYEGVKIAVPKPVSRATILAMSALTVPDEAGLQQLLDIWKRCVHKISDDGEQIRAIAVGIASDNAAFQKAARVVSRACNMRSGRRGAPAQTLANLSTLNLGT